MADRQSSVLLLALCIALLAGHSFAEDDGGMCTMEKKKTCSGDTEGEDAAKTEGAGHYSEEANKPAEDESGNTESLPMSTIDDKPKEAEKAKAPYWEGLERMHIACVVCNDRAPEALVMMKSGVMFSTSPLVFHVFTEGDTDAEITKEMETWKDVKEGRVSLQFHPVKYPLGEDAKLWRENFKPCATMRLFIPTTTDIDAILYMDTDTLFLAPVEKLWRHFRKFNSTQMAAASPESEDLVNGWYPRYARHPFYGKAGINSGVMLMNLTRIRKVKKKQKWTKEIVKIFHKYRYNISWGDQCILNIYFHRHPGRLYSYPCEWNYRPDHCMYGVNNCGISSSKTPKVLHGNRRSFFDKPRQPYFKSIYDEFVKQPANNDVDAHTFTAAMEEEFKSVSEKDRCLTLKKHMITGVRQGAMAVASRKRKLMGK